MRDARTARPLLIAVPFYKNERLVAPAVGSLIRAGAELRALDAEVVLYDDSPDYPALADALRAVLPEAAAAFAVRVERNAANMGFVRTMNLAIAEAVRDGRDLLLLNSDTVVEPGAIAEMVRVMRSDAMTGFVNPRSNNATIATLPISPRLAEAAPGVLRAAQGEVARRLPPASIAPTGVGFCLLVRWNVLAEFGGFDEVFGAGYNEENDLVMRAARCGYRVVQANQAYVWHESEASFGTAPAGRDLLETRNRAILDARYPEYGGYTAAFLHTPERHAEALLAELVPDADGRLDLALDFSGFRADHNGTFKAGRQLLAVADAVWGARFRTHVICTEEVYAFHRLAETGVPRVDPHAGRTFAAVFRVGQPFDWHSVLRLMTSGAVVGVYMLDTIAVDCPQLTSAFLYHLWQFAIAESDVLAAQSAHTAAQFEMRFALPERLIRVVAPHSLDLAEYAPAAPGTGDATGLLVVGNHFPHKFLVPTANALASALPTRRITVLGVPAQTRPGEAALATTDNIVPVTAGLLADDEISRLYAGAEAVIFPSHAEGFGFPVLDALAAGKPVFVRRIPVFEDMWEALGRTPNMHLYDTTSELVARLRAPVHWIGAGTPVQAPDTTYGAARIADALSQALDEITYARIRDRIRAVQFASALADEGRRPEPRGHGPQAARLLAERVERAAAPVLSLRPVFLGTRAVFRVVRWARRLVR